jgi:predicted transcriptional regulator
MTGLELLQNKIEDSGMKITAIAEKSGILRATLYNKLAGKSDFTAREIVGLTDALNLTKKERDDIFFTR